MRSIIVFLLLANVFCLKATTISPPKNLPELGRMSEVVVLAQCSRSYATEVFDETRFRFDFTSVQVVRGEIPERFTIQNLHVVTAIGERTILGDNEFEDGQTYLLFLNHQEGSIWRPVMLSYGVYIQKMVDRINHLFPLEDLHTHILTKEQAEPLHIYERNKLLQLLPGSIRGEVPWDHNQAKSNPSIRRFKPILRAAPGHCDFIGGTYNAHWENFPATNLPVKYHSGGDPGCNNEDQHISDAITTMNNTYEGVNLLSNGTHSYSPGGSCSDATGSGFTSYILNTYGTSRYILIQFEDPCDEMAPLGGWNNCNGVQAYGGLWFGGTHTENGITWYDGKYGYVVTNQRFGNCNCNDADYENIMIHELTHALGIGHISSSYGEANMNPSNADGITGLDIACLDYSYPPSPSSCNNEENISGVTYSSSTTIKAHNKITLDDVQVSNGATLTLIAPVIDLGIDVITYLNSSLVTISEDQCN